MTLKQDTKSPLILLVDDDPVIRRMTSEALKYTGFSVEESQNGKESLEAFQRLNPDIVLMDVEMPVMNGFEACERLRKIPGGESVPILMITGLEDSESIEKSYTVGATDFISKPVSMLILTQRIRYMLRASKAFQQLKISKARLANAQRIARLGGWEMDPVTKQFHFSTLASDLFGLDSKEYLISYNKFLSFVHPDDRKTISHLFSQIIYIGKPFSIDHRILLPDGSERIVTQQVKASVQNNSILRIVGTTQDITERKKAEILESDRNHILELIIQNSPMQNIFQELLHIIERQNPGAMSTIAIVRDNELHVKAYFNLPGTFINQINCERIGENSGCLGIAAYIGDTVIVNPVETHPLCQHLRDILLSYEIKSYYTTPVLSGKGKILGTVTIFHRKPYQPIDRDLNLIQSASRLVAIAIEKYHLVEELEHQSRHDVLTGLPNRASASEFLEHSIAQATRNSHKLAILFIDLDRFKNVNDSLGHHIGDMLLKQVAERFKTCTRDTDVLARMGGDEFIRILYNVDGRNGAIKAAQRILEELDKPFIVDDHTLHVGASIGISLFPDDGLDPITLQKNADAAMYYAKNLGGKRLHLFTQDIKTAVVERLELENELRKAIERKDFELHYQPQYTLKNKKVIGFEALLRWNHPEYGHIPPNKFIPIAEESGLIIPIGEWVLKEACRQNMAWQQKGYGFFRIAVNVSVVQLMTSDLIGTIRKTLEETGLDPRWLEIELTESLIIKDFTFVSSLLTKLQDIGIAVAIDDFGTGYSSMSYLHQLPINCLKIDQSFIKEVMKERDASDRIRSMIKTLIHLAQALKLKVVAEGVENDEQFQFLKEIGCEIGQGFFFNVPMSANVCELKKCFQ